jgi:hypothetical protein
MNTFLEFLLRLNPLIEALTLTALIVYVCKTWSMADAASRAARASADTIHEMRLSREEQAKPKVVCYFEHNESRRQTYDLVIRNYGNSAAFNVKLVFSPELERYGATRLPPLKGKTFQIMAPGYGWRTFWDSFPGSDKSSMPDEFVASVSYDWDAPRKHETYQVRFDIKSLMGITWLPGTTIEESLREIAESAKSVASALEEQAEAKRHRDG